MIAVLVVPLLFLALLEGGLRLVGFGYNPHYWVSHPAAAPGTLVENQRFPWRFFPRTLARHPQPQVVTPRKPAGVYRVLVLGESAAEGDPAPPFSFTRILQVLLQARYPGAKFEVINVAFTAINSHVILPQARDCTALESDLWLVYMGNNEVIGPYGPGTAFTGQTLPLPLIRAAVTLKGLRLGQLVDALNQRWHPSEDAVKGWGGMTMFSGRQFLPEDARLAAVYGSFQRNLDDLIRAGRSSGAQVLLGTVASNLREWPPFASLHRPGLSAAQLAAWTAAYDSGAKAEADGDFAKAIPFFEQAAQLDDRFADLHFRWARCLMAAGRAEAARPHFILARDCDALRFRTDSRLNQIIRDTARARASEAIRLVDTEARFATQSTNGLPGNEWFLEHVHFTFAGNYLLARTFADEIVACLPAATAQTNAAPAWLSEADCAARLAYTVNWQYEIVELVARRLSEQVYAGQLEAAARTERLERRLTELRAQNKPAARQRAVQLCRQAVAAAPEDPVLRASLARSLAGVDDVAGAIAAWREAARLQPHDATSYFELGQLAVQQGQAEEALALFRRAVDVNPDHAKSHEALALLHAQLGRQTEARRHARLALELDPNRTKAAALLAPLPSR